MKANTGRLRKQLPGIVAVLVVVAGYFLVRLLFPWASIAPPYHFTEHVDTWIGWLIVSIIVVSGSVLNGMLTGRMWLIAGWVSVYVLQAVFRWIVLGTSIPAALGMTTGVAFVLFTNYMITDLRTSPSKPASQFAFGGGIAVIYGFLVIVHIAYGLFFATAIVCLIRGFFLWSLHFSNKAREQFEAQQRSAAVAELSPVRVAV